LEQSIDKAVGVATTKMTVVISKDRYRRKWHLPRAEESVVKPLACTLYTYSRFSRVRTLKLACMALVT